MPPLPASHTGLRRHMHGRWQRGSAGPSRSHFLGWTPAPSKSAGPAVSGVSPRQNSTGLRRSPGSTVTRWSGWSRWSMWSSMWMRQFGQPGPDLPGGPERCLSLPRMLGSYPPLRRWSLPSQRTGRKHRSNLSRSPSRAGRQQSWPRPGAGSSPGSGRHGHHR